MSEEKKPLTQLSYETAEILMQRIAAEANGWSRPDHLKDLAEAYAIVAGAMPKPGVRTGRVVVS